MEFQNKHVLFLLLLLLLLLQVETQRNPERALHNPESIMYQYTITI